MRAAVAEVTSKDPSAQNDEQLTATQSASYLGAVDLRGGAGPLNSSSRAATPAGRAPAPEAALCVPAPSFTSAWGFSPSPLPII